MIAARHDRLASKLLDSIHDSLIIRSNDDPVDEFRLACAFVHVLNQRLARAVREHLAGKAHRIKPCRDDRNGGQRIWNRRSTLLVAAGQVADQLIDFLTADADVAVGDVLARDRRADFQRFLGMLD